MNFERRTELAAQAFSEAVPTPRGWWRANCPFCPLLLGKTDKKRAWSVNILTGGWHCFRCGTSGKLDLTGPEVETARDRVPVEETIAMRPPPGFVSLMSAEGRGSLSLAPARTYLMGRGLGPDRWAATGIGACSTGRYSDRVIVPVLADDDETWLGWVGRVWVKKAEVPYLYPPGMKRGEILYNHRALHVETDDPVYVVEGVFDSLALWPRAVALLGKPSGMQVEALVNARRPVVVVLDGDAHEEGWALAMKLRFNGQRAGNVRLPPRIDPDEVPATWLIEEARRSLTA